MSSENVEIPVVESKPEKPPRVIKSRKLWSENKQNNIITLLQSIPENCII